jgi:glycerol-3-phosphate dehydrogenase
MDKHVESFAGRSELLDQLRRGENTDWDVIVIGGGITGAGVLREAARLGLRVLLLEQKDFAWGTSSRSSKMVHGGLRYLASGDWKLTRHSLLERERLLQELPGLVERMGYYFTVREGTFPGRFAMGLVLRVYDLMAGIKDHRFVALPELLQRFQGLSQKSLRGACYYTDAITDDARLVLRVLQEARAEGARTLNYVSVSKLLLGSDGVEGVEACVPETGEILSLTARVVINATGAWADRLRGQLTPEKRIRPLRGSHIVLPYDALPVDAALALLHPRDKRAVFVFPWEGASVVGTTDLDHPEDLDIEASISNDEVDYLLEVVQQQFPTNTIGRENILSTYAGVRPVIAAEQAKDPSKERRDHAVWFNEGLVTVSGGKLTTFRLIALDALAAAAARLPAPKAATGDRVFTPTTVTADSLKLADRALAQRLVARFGNLATRVVEEAGEGETRRLAGSDYCLAELRFSLRHEGVMQLDDLLLRRTRLGQLLADGASALLVQLKPLCQQELGWSEDYWQSECQRYQLLWSRYYGVPLVAPEEVVHAGS